MAFVQFSQVSLAFGDRDILKNVTINLQTGSKVALTGANGSGKSTLIKVLAGLTAPDSGERAVQKECRIAYLPQSGLTHQGCTLLQEADKAFRGELTRSFSVGSDRGNKTCKQGFNIRWMHIPPKKIAANMYGGGKVGLVGVLFAAAANDHASGDALGKVVHGKPCENLLEDVLHFFGMKSGQANRVLEVTERGFNTPTHGIEQLEIIRREVEVCDNSLVRIVRNLEADNAERNLVEQHRVSFAAGGWEKIERTAAGHMFVMVFIFVEHFCFIRLFV